MSVIVAGSSDDMPSDRLALEQAEQLILRERLRAVRRGVSATLLASVSNSDAHWPPGLPMIS